MLSSIVQTKEFVCVCVCVWGGGVLVSLTLATEANSSNKCNNNNITIHNLSHLNVGCVLLIAVSLCHRHPSFPFL